jgi:hypothetical protein
VLVKPAEHLDLQCAVDAADAERLEPSSPDKALDGRASDGVVASLEEDNAGVPAGRGSKRTSPQRSERLHVVAVAGQERRDDRATRNAVRERPPECPLLVSRHWIGRVDDNLAGQLRPVRGNEIFTYVSSTSHVVLNGFR